MLTCAMKGDENDPELAYRDIAKFNIVQVAGKLNDFYLNERHCPVDYFCC